MVNEFFIENGFISDKNEGCWAGQRDPSPSPESQRVLERSDFYFGKRNCFLQLQKEYAKLKITYFVLNEMCEHKKFTIIGWMSGWRNGDMYYRTRYGCNACGYEWMDD
jgi:hypothetical protein